MLMVQKGPARTRDKSNTRMPCRDCISPELGQSALSRKAGRVLKNCCAAHLLRCGPPGVLTYCLVRSARQAPPRLASGLARDVFEHPATETRHRTGRAERTA